MGMHGVPVAEVVEGLRTASRAATFVLVLSV